MIHFLIVVCCHIGLLSISYAKNGPKSGSYEVYTTSLDENIYKFTRTNKTRLD